MTTFSNRHSRYPSRDPVLPSRRSSQWGRRSSGGSRALAALLGGVAIFLLWQMLHTGAQPTNKNGSSNVSTTTPAVNVPQKANATKNTQQQNTNVALNSNGAANANSTVPQKNTNTSTNAVDGPLACSGVVSRHGDKPNIALTFDAGAATGSAAEIVDILVETNTPAAFFVTGKWMEQNMELARSIVKDGFPLYNHSYDHPHPKAISADALTGQLERTATLIQQAGAADPKPFFRPPYGEYDDTVIGTISQAGYCLVTWTVDALDWQADATPEASKARVLSKIQNGGIVLMHVGDTIVPQFLPDLIADLREKGLTIIGLKTLLQG